MNDILGHGTKSFLDDANQRNSKLIKFESSYVQITCVSAPPDSLQFFEGNIYGQVYWQTVKFVLRLAHNSCLQIVCWNPFLRHFAVALFLKCFS